MGYIEDRARALKLQAEQEAARWRQQAAERAYQEQLEDERQAAEAAAQRSAEHERATAKLQPTIQNSGVRELLADLHKSWGCGQIIEEAHDSSSGYVSTTIRLAHSYPAGRWENTDAEGGGTLEGAAVNTTETSVRIAQKPDGSIDLTVEGGSFDHYGFRDRVRQLHCGPADAAQMQSFIADALAADLNNRRDRGQMPKQVERDVRKQLENYLKTQPYVSREARTEIKRALRGGF